MSSLLTGHHFRPAAYQVGGPIGVVYDHPKHRELRLGQLLAITKTNLGAYADTFSQRASRDVCCRPASSGLSSFSTAACHSTTRAT